MGLQAETEALCLFAARYSDLHTAINLIGKQIIATANHFAFIVSAFHFDDTKRGLHLPKRTTQLDLNRLNWTTWLMRDVKNLTRLDWTVRASHSMLKG